MSGNAESEHASQHTVTQWASEESDVSAKLQRVLDALDKQQRQGLLELALVIVLALTALASTWCAYQSQLWSGVQLVRLQEADTASHEAQANTLAALQRKTQDGLVAIHFMEAIQRKDTTAMEALRRRAPSPLREALDASMALDPLNNPDAPGPLRMPQYVLQEDQNANKARTSAVESRSAAQLAGQNGDAYVLLTLLFATVMFFGGITSTFQSRRLRIGLACVACGLFAATLARLAVMPVCSG